MNLTHKKLKYEPYTYAGTEFLTVLFCVYAMIMLVTAVTVTSVITVNDR